MRTPKTTKSSYDPEANILFFRIAEGKYLHSEEVGDIIVDLDTQHKIIALEIFDASTFFNISRSLLSSIREFRVACMVKDGKVKLSISLYYSSDKETTQEYAGDIQGVKDLSVSCRSADFSALS